MKLVAILELKDGRILIDKGMLTKQTTLNFEQYQKLTNEEKQFLLQSKLFILQKKRLTNGIYTYHYQVLRFLV